MIDFNEIPEWWPLCPGYECEQKGECLRYAAFRQAPARLTCWKCVLPCTHGENGCPYYQKAEKTVIARGFSQIYNQIDSRDGRYNFREVLTNYFGSKGSYYRYKDGVKPLNAEHQQKIRSVLQRYAPDVEAVFDETEMTYDFTRITKR